MAGFLKPSGIAKLKLGGPVVSKIPKLPKISMKVPKMPGALKTKPLGSSNLWKTPKMPKSPKIAIIKTVIKKLKK